MSKTIRNRHEARAWHERWDPLAPKAGDPAPDFELGDIAGERQVRLSQFWAERPVALVFGSFT